MLIIAEDAQTVLASAQCCACHHVNQDTHVLYEKSSVGRGLSQDKGTGVAGGVDSGEEERCNLREHLVVGQRAASLGVLGSQQKLRKAASLGLPGLDVLQQALHYCLFASTANSLRM